MVTQLIRGGARIRLNLAQNPYSKNSAIETKKTDIFVKPKVHV